MFTVTLHTTASETNFITFIIKHKMNNFIAFIITHKVKLTGYREYRSGSHAKLKLRDR